MEYYDYWQDDDDGSTPETWWEQAELASPSDAMPEGYLRAYYDSGDEWIGEQPYEADEYTDSLWYDDDYENDDYENEPATPMKYHTSVPASKKLPLQPYSLNHYKLKIKHQTQDLQHHQDWLLSCENDIPLPEYTGSHEDELRAYQDATTQISTPNSNNYPSLPTTEIDRGQRQTKSILRNIDAFYDDSGYYAYVLLRKIHGQVTNSDIKHVITQLQRNGIQKILSGRSYRPASNGIQYQYYIRVIDAQGQKPHRSIVDRVLRETINKQTQNSTDNHKFVQQLQEMLAREQQEKQALLERLRTSESRQAVAEQKIVTLTREQSELKAYIQKSAIRFKDEKTKLLSEIGDLQAELEQVLQQDEENKQQIAKLNADRQQTAAALAKIQTERAKADEEYTYLQQVLAAEKDDLERRMQEQENKYIDACNERDIIAAEKEKLEAEIIDLKNKNQMLSKQVDLAANSRRIANDFKNILNCLLPHLDICEESIYFLLEVKNYTKVLQELRELNSNPQALISRSKRVKSTKDWWEISHVSIGDSDNGRIYYAKFSTTNKYIVLVSHKETQKKRHRENQKMEVVKFTN